MSTGGIVSCVSNDSMTYSFKEGASLLTWAEVVNWQRAQTNEDRDPDANQPPAELG